jgi:hypothetical protein
MKGFSRWLRDYVKTCSNNVVINDEIRNLAAGPVFTVTRYEAMDINGYTFYTMTKDKKSVYQNSGVRVRRQTVMMMMTQRHKHIMVKYK